MKNKTHRCNESANVRHVHHKESAVGVANFAESSVIPLPRVRAAARNDQVRLEQRGELLELIVINQPRL